MDWLLHLLRNLRLSNNLFIMCDLNLLPSAIRQLDLVMNTPSNLSSPVWVFGILALLLWNPWSPRISKTPCVVKTLFCHFKGCNLSSAIIIQLQHLRHGSIHHFLTAFNLHHYLKSAYATHLLMLYQMCVIVYEALSQWQSSDWKCSGIGSMVAAFLLIFLKWFNIIIEIMVVKISFSIKNISQ